MKMRIAVIALATGLLGATAIAQGMNIPQPSRGLMPNPSVGKPLFVKNCASCHGDALNGSDKGPPLIHKYYEPSHHSDAAFQLAVSAGTRQHHWQFGDMQPVPGLTPDEVAHITAYVRARQRRAGIH